MVLIVSTEKEERERAAEKKDRTYAFTLYNSNVGLISDESADHRPDDSVVQQAILSSNIPDHPTFFLLPFEGLISGEEKDSKSSPLSLLVADIMHCVGRRENVTLINRGVKGDRYLEEVLLAVLEATKSSAEYAMQVVADEVAKQKQMQRLLQLEGDQETKEGRDVLKNIHVDQTNMKPKGLTLSKKLRGEIKQFSKDYSYGQTKGAKHDSRFTVVSSLHGEELHPPCQGESQLTPESFRTNPPTYRKAQAELGTERNIRSHSYIYNQRKRKSTLDVLSDFTETPADTEQIELKGNGWGSTTRFFQFDGESSIMSLPGIPRFEDLVKSFGIDFWIRTDCKPADGKKIIFNILEGQREDLGQLFHLGLNWYEEMEAGFHIFCRDSTNRVLEAVVPLPKTTFVTGKDFHHVMIRLYSLDEGQIECLIDGKAVTPQLVQNEHPIAFNPWPHRLFVGGHLDENNSPVKVFRGTIMQLRFWSLGETPKPVIAWPLLVEDGKLSELTKNIPEDHHETLQNLQRIEEAAPSCAPFFDGNLVANMGALATWGELMQNWRVELRFRTDVTGRMMNLFGVTDQKYKMQEVGIVLNAEPVFSKERVHYHELNTTFYIVDAFGACCSALLRGTDRQNLMDGGWHTLVWRCIDSESNKFSVKIDGVYQDLLYVSRDGPHRFDAFENWMCVAGHNVRNWKVVRPFTGQMSRFYVSLRGYRYVTLHMNEGPGAYVMQDRSGHRNHGLLINPTTNAVRKMDTIWMPAQEETEVTADDGPKLDVVVFKNNTVTIACVIFTCDADEKGIAREIIYDVYHQQNFDLQVVDHHISDSRKEWKTWRCIPDACYKPLETVTQLEEAINYVIAAKVPRGHLMVVLRVGDCHVTFLHVQEPEFPDGATYNCNMLKWHYPYMVEGLHGKRELMLNRMIEGMESVLMCDSLTPFTTARLGPLNVGTGQSIVSEDIIRSLQNSGRPWFLPSVLHHNLLNSEYGSSLHIIHRIYPNMNYNEAAAVALFNKRLHDSAKEKATIVIQRNWRGKLAKSEAMQKQTQRQIRDRKIEEIRTFRMNPVVQAKQRLYALLITLHEPKTPKVPPIVSDIKDMHDALVKQGYDVERLESPSLQTLMKVISQIDSDKSSFIFVSGYGGIMNLKQPPLLSLQALHVSLQEGNTRADIISEQGKALREMVASFRASLQNMQPAKKKKKDNAAAKKKPDDQDADGKDKDMQFTNALRAVEQEESFQRDAMAREWETEVQLISKTIRQAVVTTREYEAKYKQVEGQPPRYYVYPVECKRVEPYANQVVDVDDIIQTALHRQAPPIGLQSIVAIDLQPITPYSRGVACLASSTGNTLKIPYNPDQRCIATVALTKAMDGHLSQISATSKYAVLSGGIETRPNQRDWKSFASYFLSKLRCSCTQEQFQELRAELDRELPFTAELIPVRDIVLTDDMKERLRRDREAQKVTAQLTFGVGSLKVQSDMFSIFKNVLPNLSLTELVFANVIHILFTKQNKGIDGLLLDNLRDELEKLRPSGCTVPIDLSITNEGAKLVFESQDNSDRLSITQWLNSIVLRSITWQIGVSPLDGYTKLEVEYIEYVYSIKTSCSARQYFQLIKNMYKTPIPSPFIRFLNCETVAEKR